MRARAGRRLPDIRQAEAAECGLACLAMVATYHGHRIDLGTLRRRQSVSLKGMSLGGLIEAAAGLQLAGRPLRLEPAQLGGLRLPAILHWDMRHFVVLKRVRGRRLVLHDPARGEIVLGLAELSQHFTGIALELAPTAEFRRADHAVRLRLRDLLGGARGIGGALAQVIGLSAILQAYVLASPFCMQIAVDQAIAKDDRDLLAVLALGFGLFLLVNAAAGLLRSWLLVHLQGSLAFGLGADLFRHLLRLPLQFFERRNIGDLVSRFTALDPIRTLLAEGVAAAVVDGAMALLTAAMVFLYSPRLGLVVIGSLVAYAALRLGCYHALHHRSLDLVQARARENNVFVETARAMQSIKIFNREAGRVTLWSNRHAEVVGAAARVDRLNATFRCANEVIFGAENLLVIWLGAGAVLDGDMTVGMLFAFMAYKQQFVDKSVRLVEKAIEFRMLDLHLERLADIVRADPEPDAPAAMPQLQGVLELRDVSFRYAPGEPFVLEDVSLRVGPGDYVAITGPSGGGKTTLLKIMLGLLEPERGEVLVDGVPLTRFGARGFREQAGVVMQDDQLLSGSIADNICFFDDGFDFERMRRSAEIAGVLDEILAMPMGFESLIGDMGSSLSGGQRQRVLLARALYREPRFLFMDEGTAHLDTDTEARVNAAIGALGLTRVIIAHRPETIASASRRLVLAEGRLHEAPVRTPRGEHSRLEMVAL